MTEPSETITIELAGWTLQAANSIAQSLGMSLDAFIQAAIHDKIIAHMSAKDFLRFRAQGAQPQNLLKILNASKGDEPSIETDLLDGF
jgi:hypothetical protein